MDATNGIASVLGRESRASGMMSGGLRASSGNLSHRILDKRFNKMLFNMHGIPVSGNISNNKKQKVNQVSTNNNKKMNKKLTKKKRVN